VRKKSRPLTLLELLVIIAIITLFSSVFGVNVVQMVKEYRFEQSCGSIATELYASGRIARMQGGAIEVHLSVDQKGLLFRRTTDEAIPVDTYFFTFVKLYKGVEHVEVDGKSVEKCTIRFTPGGVAESEVVLKYRERFHKIPLHLL